jgi:hypothetical protein
VNRVSGNKQSLDMTCHTLLVPTSLRKSNHDFRGGNFLWSVRVQYNKLRTTKGVSPPSGDTSSKRKMMVPYTDIPLNETDDYSVSGDWDVLGFDPCSSVFAAARG